MELQRYSNQRTCVIMDLATVFVFIDIFTIF